MRRCSGAPKLAVRLLKLALLSKCKHPFFAVKFKVMMAACGVHAGQEDIDITYVDRLAGLCRTARSPAGTGAHGRLMLLPFDQTYDKQGNA